MTFKIAFNVLSWACNQLNIVAHLTAENQALQQQLLVLKRSLKRLSLPKTLSILCNLFILPELAPNSRFQDRFM